MKNTVLLTGSYGGLGSCLAKIHAKRGGDLILVGRSMKELEEQKSELQKKYNIQIECIEADLSNEDAPQAIYDECKKNGWTVDYLINNAGFGGQGDFTRERTLEQDIQMMRVNMETPTRLMKLFSKTA